MWKSKRIAEILKTECNGDPQVPVFGCVIDSRQTRGGEAFFALVGEKVDGHDYIEVAWENGANLVIAEKARMKEQPNLHVPEGKAFILVESGLNAMQELAKVWRQELGAKVVGITGSNGKTTTKDMVAAVLAQKYQVHKNKENQNNEFGVPMTLLNAPATTEILVVEMGMRGLGQIRALCDFVRPDTGVITNIGTTHMELLGSQENIAKAKWELIEALPVEGTAVLNGEDFWSVKMAETDPHLQIYYGIEGKYHQPNLQGMNLVPTGTLGTQFEIVTQSEHGFADLPLPGEHNVLDALSALAVGEIYGISMEEGCRGLAELELSKMRLELHPGIRESRLLSDVYNANPTSMQASLKVLSERSSQATLAILGEMYELGEASASGHYAVGQSVAQLGITELITVGCLAEEIARGALESGMPQVRVHVCPDRDRAISQAKMLLNSLGDETWVLIKASRGMKMEKITEALQIS
ncbi:UDP-N-acetylmuramoyl-tripeptide--D-alanyl-D-alanine ligase [Desulfitobacterium sp.]|uniref:UDP-N-acetylmuramoyl-tripeptide--D-alanyl-D- alanine ligase n=1 Tax=Desulfitobacterium sp. TaxID=49981 RepID=UPI002C51AB4B|nr:UDP-N-acetylmuramoyl-tripeptide--D-alanyl-D-alanine ligase [Desulfitobacterium sp.]HVJ48194.1 UDP-N-acetylmuramoyl-tripeptide--D-alanyl-D-alanine ligase [Desulfitobacterium sp.]